ncbi:MAG: VWA domain-containing protein [Myxococcales bacterium]|nr:VWA domain-containing protein [Myxococcales bacterium]
MSPPVDRAPRPPGPPGWQTNRWVLLGLALSVLLHVALFAYLRGVSLGLPGASEETETALTLAPDAPASAEAAPEPKPLPRPKPKVTAVRPLPTETFRPDPITAEATQIFESQPAAVAQQAPAFGSGRPGAFGSFDDMLDEMRRHGLDVVIAIDTTGSMGWVIEEVRDRIDELVDVVRGFVPKTRFGVVAYRDFDAAYVTKVLPLTYRNARLREFLNGLDAEGGGDIFEAVEPAIVDSIEKTGFRSEAVQVVIVVGDAPPHPETMGRLIDRVGAFRSRGGVVTLLDVSLISNPEVLRKLHGVDPAYRASGLIPQFAELADAGGGEVVNLGGTAKVARNLAVAIFGTQWLDWLVPFLGGLE